MTARGQQTIARLIGATRQVIREAGYANATTRRIADAAGVTEGTINRHFPSTRALLLAAVMHNNPDVIAEMSTLPDRAGQATLAENLTWALQRLASMREDILPLELALLTEPELAEEQPPTSDAATPEAGGADGPPDALTEYLAAEQTLGRIRPDIDPAQGSYLFLVLLFGLTAAPQARHHPGATAGIDVAVTLVLEGLASPTSAENT